MSAPTSASSSPAITLRKVDPTATRRMSSVKSGPAVATFTSFSLHVNDLDASLTFFQSLFQWSVIRHEEHDIKDAAGEGVNNGAHSITYVGPSSKDFTLALVYNYGVTLTQETPLHHIAISCNIEKTLSLAKQHEYDIKQEDGDTCVISADGHRYKLVNVEGEIEKPNVAYVSIFTKSLIRSSDFYTTVLSMSTSTDTPCTTQFPADVKHSMYGYASNQVQLQLVQFPHVCDKRERLIITCKDVSSMSTRIKSARATLLHQDGVYDMTRDKDGYVIVVANEKEWGKKMEAGENKIDAEERSRILEMTRVWMKTNPTPAPDPMAHISRATPPPPPVTHITSPGSIERKSSLSNPSSRSSSPMNVVSPTPSPTSVSVISNSSSTSTASSTNSSILKLPNAKPAHTRLITTDPHPSVQEYENTIGLLQEQLIQKSNELNMAYEKIKNKMEQVKEILQLKEDENQRLRQQLKDAGIAPCVPHQSIGQLIATPVQAVRRLSASRTSTSTPPPSQGRSLTSTPPPSSSQGRNSSSTPPPPPPSQGRSSTSSPVPSQNQEPIQPRVVSPVA